MRISQPALSMLALAVAVHLMATGTQVAAADLGVTGVKKKVVRVIHTRMRVVADYDGTAVVLRPSGKAVLVAGPDGAPVLTGLLETRPVPGAMPTHTINGDPLVFVPLPPPRRDLLNR